MDDNDMFGTECSVGFEKFTLKTQIDLSSSITVVRGQVYPCNKFARTCMCVYMKIYIYIYLYIYIYTYVCISVLCVCVCLCGYIYIYIYYINICVYVRIMCVYKYIWIWLWSNMVSLPFPWIGFVDFLNSCLPSRALQNPGRALL